MELNTTSAHVAAPGSTHPRAGRDVLRPAAAAAVTRYAGGHRLGRARIAPLLRPFQSCVSVMSLNIQWILPS